MAEKPEITLVDIDLVGFDIKDWQQMATVINTLGELTNQYSVIEDIGDVDGLEILKRKFVGHLQYFAPMYAKVKKFKDSNHQYLGEHRKRLKSESMKRLDDNGVKVTQAKEIVYDEQFYKDRLRLIERVSEKFELVENSYKRYESTLQCIVQSISVAKEEQNYNRVAG